MAGNRGGAPGKTRWGIVALAIAAGVVAAIQVGKVPPLITQLQADLDLSLVAAGWLASRRGSGSSGPNSSSNMRRTSAPLST